jgi:hypothetical protein
MRHLLLLLIGCAGSLFAGGFAPDADTFDPVPALRQAAKKFFPESVEATLEVTRTQRVDRFAEGFRTETYDVRSSKGNVGQLFRFQAFLDPRSQADLVLRIKDHQLVAIDALRPVVFKNHPFTRLQETFAPLKGKPIAQLAAGLSRVFAALGKLKEAEVPPGPVPKPSPGTPPLVSAIQEALALGQPIPAFEVTDSKGTKVTAASFKKQLVLFVLGTLTDSVSNQMLDGAARVCAGLPAIRFVPSLKNFPDELAPMGRWLSEPEAVLSRALIDPGGTMQKAFKAPNLPYLFVFDTAGRLVYRNHWEGEDQFKAAVQGLLAKGVK